MSVSSFVAVTYKMQAIPLFGIAELLGEASNHNASPSSPRESPNLRGQRQRPGAAMSTSTISLSHFEGDGGQDLGYETEDAKEKIECRQGENMGEEHS